MKKKLIIAGWLCLIVLLIILANTMPTLENKTKAAEFTYQHPQDNYSLDVQGLWQVYDTDKTSLTLVNAEYDCTIELNLEVGGYDYLTPTAAANKFIAANTEKFPDFTVTEGPAEGSIGGYTSAAYLCTFSQGKDAYCGEMAVVHPNEGIRLYMSFIYPADCETQIVQEGEAIMRSLKFSDTEALYPKFM